MRTLSLVFFLALASCTPTEMLPANKPPTTTPPPSQPKPDTDKPAILGPEASLITYERIAKSPEPGMVVPHAPSFSPDGKLLTYLASESQDDRLALFAYDLEAKTSSVLVRASDLVKEPKMSREEELRRERQRQRATGVTEYRWARNANVMVLPLGGDLYVRSAGGTITRLTTTREPEIDPKLNEDGSKVAFVRGGDLYVIDVATKAETQLTKGAVDGFSHGLSDFNGQEEFDEPSGFWWSPDGSKIAYLEVDERMVKTVPVLGYRNGASDLMMQKYPLTGGVNPTVKAGIIDVKTKHTTWLKWPRDDEHYLARFVWSRDSKALFVQSLSRDQRRLALGRADATTGTVAEIVTETSPTWVELAMMTVLEKGDRFVWTSRLGGHTHAQLRDAKSGAVVAQLTKGDFDVTRLAGTDEEKGLLFFSSSFDGPIESNLYSTTLAGGGAPKRLTPERGTHDTIVSKKGDRMFDVHSAVGRLPRAVLRGPDGAVTGEIALPADPEVEGLKLRTAEMVSFKGPSGDVLYGQLLKPRALDPNKRYPVLVYVYGGPGEQVVRDLWHPNLLWQHLADRGVVVFALDNRGSKGRGPGFQDPIYQRMGVVELEDQLAGLAWLGSQPFADVSRAAIYGHSYGGFMAALAMLKAPGKFKVGIAGSPVTNFALYDTGYTERYMSTPLRNPSGYDGTDLSKLAVNLEGKLLVIHALMDENVHFQNTANLVDALVAANKSFDFFAFPGERHGYRGPGARLYAMKMVIEYLAKNL